MRLTVLTIVPMKSDGEQNEHRSNEASVGGVGMNMIWIVMTFVIAVIFIGLLASLFLAPTDMDEN